MATHQRHNHDNRRRPKYYTGSGPVGPITVTPGTGSPDIDPYTPGGPIPVDKGPRPPVSVGGGDDDSSSASTYADTTGTDKTSESVSIPASLIEQQQAAESQNQEYPVVQQVTPPRPLGL